MKNMLSSEWEVTDLGEPHKMVSIEVMHTDNSISISQQKYIENLLHKEEMLDVNPVAMPMDPNIKLAPNLDNNKLNCSNSYAKLLGCLQFILNLTRLDISFAVSKLAAYTANPGLQHHSAIKWILRYLAGMENLGITYGNTPGETNNPCECKGCQACRAPVIHPASSGSQVRGRGWLCWPSRLCHYE